MNFFNLKNIDNEWSLLLKEFSRKVYKPDFVFEKITSIDENVINRLKNEYEIEGIIIDVDETLRKYPELIPNQNKEWLSNIKDKFKLVILSNGFDERLKDYFSLEKIEYITGAFKPLKAGYRKAKEYLNLDSKKILVIGDSGFDDIFGGKINGMYTALIKDCDDYVY